VHFSVCLEVIFNTLPFAERIEQAAACRAAAVEFGSWEDKDLDAIARAKEAAGVAIAACTGMGGVPANDPRVAGAAEKQLLSSISAARQIGALGLIVCPGFELGDVPRREQLDAIVNLLVKTAPAAADANVTLLLEPLNTQVDHPGCLLTRSDEAADLLDRVDHPNARMLYDIYHQYITEGGVLESIEAHIRRIGHFHVADVPGRHEPGTGTMDYAEIFGRIASLGYDGYIGLEFFPTGDHAKAVKDTLALI